MTADEARRIADGINSSEEFTADELSGLDRYRRNLDDKIADYASRGYYGVGVSPPFLADCGKRAAAWGYVMGLLEADGFKVYNMDGSRPAWQVDWRVGDEEVR
jgi:hypothetical protein